MERRGVETDKGDVNRSVTYAAVLERGVEKAERLGLRVLEDVAGAVMQAATWLEGFLFGSGHERQPARTFIPPDAGKVDAHRRKSQFNFSLPQEKARDPDFRGRGFDLDPDLIAEIRRQREAREREEDRDRGGRER